MRKWRFANPEKARAIDKRYKEKHRPKKRVKCPPLSPEEIRARNRKRFREYYQKHRDKIIKARKEMFRRKKELIIQQLGSVCCVCGTTERLVIHHVDYCNNSVGNGAVTLKALKLGNLALVCTKHHRAITYINTLKRKGELEKVLKLLNQKPYPRLLIRDSSISEAWR
jgi:hypothetical protein